MKITSVKTFPYNAGWRDWLFVKVETDSGISAGGFYKFILFRDGALFQSTFYHVHSSAIFNTSARVMAFHFKKKAYTGVCVEHLGFDQWGVSY